MAISVGSVAVDVVPSVKGFATELKAKLKGVTAQIGLEADTSRLRAQLDEATHDRVTKITATADTGAAEAQLDAAARDRSATVRADAQGMGKVATGVSGIALAITALGLAAIPVTAAVAGLGVALGAPLAAAGGGLTIFGLIAGSAVSQTKKQQKEISDLAKKVSAAKLAVETASTKAGKKSALIREAAAVKSYELALKQLTPEQKKFIAAQGELKSSFRSLIASSGGVIFAPLIKGMNLISGVLPKLKPLITGVSDGISILLHDIGEATKSAGFNDFIKAFGTDAKNAIVTFGRIFGNFATGLFGLFEAFGPVTAGFARGLTGMSESFRKFGQGADSNKGVQRFVDYVQKIAPKVIATVGSIVKAIVHIGEALAPLGGIALAGLKGFADTISAMPVAVIRGIATAVAALVLAFKGYAIIQSASLALDRLAASATASRFIPGQFGRLKTAMRGLSGAAGIGAIAAAAGESNGAMKTLANVGGGAMLGFSVGGPIGAAIGAGAGGLWTLFQNTKKATKGFQDAPPVIGEYITTLDRLTGSLSEATRAEAFGSLQKSGAIKAANQLGIDSKVLVDAVLGNKKAQAQIQALNDDAGAARQRLVQGIGTDADAQLAKNLNILNDAVGANRKKFKEDTDIARAERLAVLDLGKAVDAIPDKKLTHIGTLGTKDAKVEIAGLIDQYDLTRKDVKTVIDVLGVNATVKQILRVRSHLDTLKDKRVKLSLDLVTKGKGGAGKAEFLLGNVEGAGARGAVINRPTVMLAGESGPEVLTPLDQTPGNGPLPGGRSAGVYVAHQTVVAHDYHDFVRQQEQRARMQNLGASR